MHALDSLSRLHCLMLLCLSLRSSPSSSVIIQETLSGSFAWLAIHQTVLNHFSVHMLFFSPCVRFVLPSNPTSSFRLLFLQKHQFFSLFTKDVLWDVARYLFRLNWERNSIRSFFREYFLIFSFFWANFHWILIARRMKFSWKLVRKERTKHIFWDIRAYQ